MTHRLPGDFADLEPFAETWCLATEAERWDQRHARPMAELQAFYDACTPRLEAAIEHCDAFPLDELPADAVALLHLIYSYVMVATAIEIFGQARTVDAADAVLDRVREPTP